MSSPPSSRMAKQKPCCCNAGGHQSDHSLGRVSPPSLVFSITPIFISDETASSSAALSVLLLSLKILASWSGSEDCLCRELIQQIGNRKFHRGVRRNRPSGRERRKGWSTLFSRPCRVSPSKTTLGLRSLILVRVGFTIRTRGTSKRPPITRKPRRPAAGAGRWGSLSLRNPRQRPQQTGQNQRG